MIDTGMVDVLVAGYLCKHCPGIGRARTQRRIAADLRCLGLAVQTRDIRDAVEVLRLAGAPVGTGTAGVWLCRDRRDWRVAYRHLYGRLRTQAAGCRRFKRTFCETTTGQARFDFAQGLDLYHELLAAPLLVAIIGKDDRA
ncbi:MAG TPA: hypothetical protein VM431_03720 [Phycisphaerae bacterium]|nr:hypothetical protein [Phycisphaerae bacterium]